MKEVTKKKNSGITMRLMQAIVYLLMIAYGGYLMYLVTTDYSNTGDFEFYTGTMLLTQASLFFIMQIIFAFVGNKSKGGNVASITLSAIHIFLWLLQWVLFYIFNLFGNENNSMYLTYIGFAAVGIFGIIGGAQGKKHGIFPEKNMRAGFACRKAQAIMDTLGIIPFAVCAFVFSSFDKLMTVIFASIAVLFVTLSILQFIFTYKGKSSKGANIGSALCHFLLIFAFWGLPGFIGGIQGVKYLKAHPECIAEPKKKKSAKAQTEAEQQTQIDETTVIDTSTAFNYDVEEANSQPVVLTQVKQLSPKAKKTMMIVEIVSYSLLLLVGILMSAIPSFGNLFVAIGLCQDVSARAYGITIGVMTVALVPSIGYYFATVAPLSLSKRNKVIIASVSAALSVIMTAVFFTVIYAVKVDGIAVNKYFENDDVWFIPVSMVFAALGIAICYAMLFFRFKPEKIKDVKAEETESLKVSHQMRYVLQSIARVIVKGLKAVLKFKENMPEIFILIATFLFTWLAYFTSFVFSIVAIVFIVALIIMVFSHLVETYYVPTSSQGGVTYTDSSSGKTVTLTEQSYVIDDRYNKVYKDEYGNEYISDNNGKTVYEYHSWQTVYKDDNGGHVDDDGETIKEYRK